jgi:hypothetical protein
MTMLRSKALPVALAGAWAVVSLGAAGCGGSTAVPPPDAGGAGGAGGAPAVDAGDDAEASPRGLVVSVRGVDGQDPAVLPVTTGDGTTIDTAAVWLSRLAIVSDQGSSTDTESLSLGIDIGYDLDLQFPAAAPGLYSLAHVDVAPADVGSTALPAGFGGQALSARVTGHLSSGRAFDISAAQASSVDLRAATPVELQPGTALQVTLSIDVSTWLQGVNWNTGDQTQPLIAGPQSHGDIVTAFSANVIQSFQVAF